MYNNFGKTITTMPRRRLSLRGKVVLLNTLILSKVTFLSNIFAIPNQILKEIQANMFKHIWQYTT